MADVQDADPSAEPSMEEILASIRRIIADEKEAPAAPPPGEDVLELTQMVQDDGSVVDVAQEPVAAPEPQPEPEPAPEPVVAAEEALPPPPPPIPEPEPVDNLVSDAAATVASSSLAALANTLQTERRASVTPGFTPLGNGGRTLEDMVLELIRPMLKAWLDENLPQVVDRLVQKEVERIARRVQE